MKEDTKQKKDTSCYREHPYSTQKKSEEHHTAQGYIEGDFDYIGIGGDLL
ncbi:MAG TPA: hypothetical protein PK926_05305 [Spirochaetota bacterium]|nr:hypothetical protein [Spirochaetota bacterium]HPI91144.1 hypothetical protein [Spirochaetota bacterium]HPR47895.1 hypothetical protein [Spirochaetota bacterium]